MKIEMHFEENERLNNFSFAEAIYKVCEANQILDAKVIAKMVVIQYNSDYGKGELLC